MTLDMMARQRLLLSFLRHIKVVALLVVILLLCSLNEHLSSAPVDKYSTKAKRERCSSRLNQHYCRLSPDARPWWNRHKQLALNNSISRWKPRERQTRR
jgi:hypothetical protein